MRDLRAWERVWIVKKDKVEVLYRLSAEGRWYKIDLVNGKILVERSVMMGDFGADAQWA